MRPDEWPPGYDLPVGNNAGLYALTDEHEAIREAVRDIAEREIAPFAAEVDADSRYPVEAQKALTAAGFHATHIPEAYGGEGADAIATCIVIEEVARVDASASLIPAVNKLGSMPIILSGVRGREAEGAARRSPRAEAMISYGLSEREAGSDAAAMKTRARLDGDTWVLNGTKAWITNAGVSEWYTVMAVTDPEKGANGISAFAVHRDDPGFAVGPKERKMGIKGSPTCELYFTDCTIPADRIIGAPGTGFKTALRTLDFTRPTIGAQAVGIAQGALDAAVAYVKDRKQFGTSDRRLPGRAVHARRHGDEDRGRPAPGLRRRRGRRAGPPRRHPGVARRRRPSPPTSPCR